MRPEYVTLNVRRLAERWWIPIVRGVAAILFGVLAIAAPGMTLLTLVLLWGAFALVDGVSNLLLAARAGRDGRSWGWLLFGGILSIAAGILTFIWPGITAMALLVVIAVWAVLGGIGQIAAAIALRRELGSEWMLATSGILSIAFGALLLLFPSSGALAVVWMIGGYAIAFGLLLIGLGLRFHKLHKAVEREIPAGGAHTTV